ncbi:tetratricopeptide (TPR) repeat protein [Pelomonas saccharophila]|uniref:Tetratricopeptide (TPR) repeat protein n=1 Tax=Roseateles saccharophilus TaxID=304 RepID=A0ABU1YG85_ROSSA|nr:tetratricopeptide repeat protein [Roseateles saccharophilus]MDR7267865.1 tetratricopeptide (TPR) repeat protein [Roseateles saccharophilus]
MTLRLLPLALALLAGAAQADLLKDPQWQGWLDAGKTADLVRAAKAKGDDDQAAVALALAAVDDNDGARLEAAIPALQACVDKRPTSANSAGCAYALGRVYGQQAMTASVFKMPGLATKTKEQFVKAVELDPQLFEARTGLTQFYLMAPGFAGGSTAKAKELAVEVQARQPEQAKVLRALLAMNDKDWTSAERELTGVKAGDDHALQRELRGAWTRVGFEHMEQKNFAKARGVFEALQRDYPAHAAGPYGLGRTALEQGQTDEAIKSLERARSLEGAERLPIDHRLGQALIAKGDKAGAKAALERFVQNKRANPRNVDDAKKLLAGLA